MNYQTRPAVNEQSFQRRRFLKWVLVRRNPPETIKHRAEKQQVARYRSEQLWDERKNCKQLSMVVSTEGKKMSLKRVFLPSFLKQEGSGCMMVGEKKSSGNQIHLIFFHHARPPRGPKWLLLIDPSHPHSEQQKEGKVKKGTKV